jgi:hypothetical protein
MRLFFVFAIKNNLNFNYIRKLKSTFYRQKLLIYQFTMLFNEKITSWTIKYLVLH